MSFAAVPIWKKAPFIRLLLPFITGIMIQWYLSCPLLLWQFTIAISLILFLVFLFFPFYHRFRFLVLTGIAATAIFIATGALIENYRDVRHNPGEYEIFNENKGGLMVLADEAPGKKPGSFKVTASHLYTFRHGQAEKLKERILIYFSKDCSLKDVQAGSALFFKKPCQPINSAGNPGSFDYKRYCLFQQITHQVYLNPGQFTVLPPENKQGLTTFLNQIRQKILAIIREYIPGEKEKGLAEALLIGYKDDLDKSLVLSYTNTGVVHIIAISGLHLGLIYWLLVLVTGLLNRKRYTKWFKPVLVITGLWVFSLLAGAQPSVLRSAVMFSGLVAGECFNRKSSIYNSLAASAFILLCYNPYWLWDPGFQLSYAAVLSIVIFMKPVYSLFYVKNKLLDLIWKMNAVTIAAQILTVPLGIYHFHQFPNLFLLTNLVAVPLSSIIVLGGILLCVVSFISPLALITGKLLGGLIRFMNTYIERIEWLPFSKWDGLQISLVQAILLFIICAGMGYWLLERQKKGLVIALFSLFCFTGLRTISFIQAQDQEKIIVYNVPRHQAIDLIQGLHFSFIGDADLTNNLFAKNFYLTPSRTLNRVVENTAIHTEVSNHNYFVQGGKHILLLDNTQSFIKTTLKQPVDLLILSKNPAISLPQLAELFKISQVVFDSSVPTSKIRSWKKDCDSLHLPAYDVNEKGAFVMNLR